MRLLRYVLAYAAIRLLKELKVNYSCETFPNGATLRVFADESDPKAWRIQIDGDGNTIDVKVLNGLELELGTIEKEKKGKVSKR